MSRVQTSLWTHMPIVGMWAHVSGILQRSLGKLEFLVGMSAPVTGINAVFCSREQDANSSLQLPVAKAGGIGRPFNDVSVRRTGNQFI